MGIKPTLETQEPDYANHMITEIVAGAIAFYCFTNMVNTEETRKSLETRAPGLLETLGCNSRIYRKGDTADTREMGTVQKEYAIKVTMTELDESTRWPSILLARERPLAKEINMNTERFSNSET